MCESSYASWKVLENLYSMHTRNQIQQMICELQYLTKGASSLEDYIQNAKSLALSLHGAGKPIDDDEFIIFILHDLEPEFDPIVATINARDVFPLLKSVIGKLQDFELRIISARVVFSTIAMYNNYGSSVK